MAVLHFPTLLPCSVILYSCTGVSLLFAGVSRLGHIAKGCRGARGTAALEELLSAPRAGQDSLAPGHCTGYGTIPSIAEAAALRLRLTPNEDLRPTTVHQFCFSEITLRHRNEMIHQVWGSLFLFATLTPLAARSAQKGTG